MYKTCKLEIDNGPKDTTHENNHRQIKEKTQLTL